MKASVYHEYGSTDVLRIEEVARPEPGPGEVLVRVRATSVTTGDWRLRAAAFPGLMAVPGRLMFGVFRPRRPILGGDFAGEVVETGAGVTRFAPGDRVFGVSGHGAHAEYVRMPESGAIHATPGEMTDEQAAALPFGGLAALTFLADFARVKPGERVLILGASGGVGSYAVQIARAMGAEVTGVASAGNLELVRSLGAHHVIDYGAQDPLRGARYDVVLDTVGVADFRRVRRVLDRGGRFVPLNFGTREIWQSLRTGLVGRRKVVIGVNGDSAEALARLIAYWRAGALRPVIDRVYPFAGIADAHAHVETRHRKGAVVVSIAREPGALRSAA